MHANTHIIKIMCLVAWSAISWWLKDITVVKAIHTYAPSCEYHAYCPSYAIVQYTCYPIAYIKLHDILAKIKYTRNK